MIIGTRGSALALWQARHVQGRLAELGVAAELLVIKTKGDKILDVPLAQVGGKGLFVKEIEEALADGRIDLAVHSMKDVPAELHPGLALSAISAREDPHDVLVGRRLDELRAGARLGTSSVRRVCQLRSLRPDLTIVPLRGNVDTRLRKLDEGQVDAIVLAAAGLRRLGHADRIAEVLDPERCLPAIGQGLLALETRAGDATTIDVVRRAVHDADGAAAADAERAFLQRLGGSCQTPLACHARPGRDRMTVDGLVGDLEGKEIIRDRVDGARADAAALGRALAEKLLARGADRLLAALA
ncbi:MAG TPA: hydroxymethylbilane synthase [Haliangiales bacterium]|nr:hydroxymethylbilane synthase [Haliangiales bacterium]